MPGDKVRLRRISSDLVLANPSSPWCPERCAKDNRREGGGRPPRCEIMFAFAESDVRGESNAFTTCDSKISRALVPAIGHSFFLGMRGTRYSRPQDLSPRYFFSVLRQLLLSMTFHGLTKRGRGSFSFNDRPCSFGPTIPDLRPRHRDFFSSSTK